ncbi:unnamed protein product [Moneuplotes crassus]|uniref:Glutathione S-transferase n=1 Tax=Euplotes crassus TaxID=5936 RepID=A0AAD2D454_EUPCR|nr:unnamed protein product [Moneuplotes crassus]
MSLKIFYKDSYCANANSIKIAADLSGAEFESVKTTKEEFTASKGDKLSLPYVEVEEQGLSETNTILRHIARLNPDSNLYGKSLYESAMIDTVLDHAYSLLEEAIKITCTALGCRSTTSADFKADKEKYVAILKELEKVLDGKDFFVGEGITIADIRVASICAYPFRLLMDPGTAKQVPNLIAHFERISANESFKKFFGTTHVAKRPIKVKFAKK